MKFKCNCGCDNSLSIRSYKEEDFYEMSINYNNHASFFRRLKNSIAHLFMKKDLLKSDTVLVNKKQLDKYFKRGEE